MTMSGWLRRGVRAVRDRQPANMLLSGGTRLMLRLGRLRLSEAALMRVPRVGTVAAAMPGGKTLRLRSDVPESVTNSVFYRGWTGVEPEVLPLWRALAMRAATVLDVGAHVGHHSLVAGLVNPSAQIHGFEPLPRVAAMFERNIALNRLGNIVLRRAAAGRAAGRTAFYAIPDQIPSSSSLSRDFMEQVVGGALQDVAVDVVTLDGLLGNVEAPLLMKIDTETTEPDVVAGARALIGRTQPVIVVEVLIEHETGPALEAELAAANFRYVPYLMTGAGLRRAAAIRGDARWRNYLLVPVDGPTIAAMRDLLPTPA